MTDLWTGTRKRRREHQGTGSLRRRRVVIYPIIISSCFRNDQPLKPKSPMSIEYDDVGKFYVFVRSFPVALCSLMTIKC